MMVPDSFPVGAALSLFLPRYGRRISLIELNVSAKLGNLEPRPSSWDTHGMKLYHMAGHAVNCACPTAGENLHVMEPPGRKIQLPGPGGLTGALELMRRRDQVA